MSRFTKRHCVHDQRNRKHKITDFSSPKRWHGDPALINPPLQFHNNTRRCCTCKDNSVPVILFYILVDRGDCLRRFWTLQLPRNPLLKQATALWQAVHIILGSFDLLINLGWWHRTPWNHDIGMQNIFAIHQNAHSESRIPARFSVNGHHLSDNPYPTFMHQNAGSFPNYQAVQRESD